MLYLLSMYFTVFVFLTLLHLTITEWADPTDMSSYDHVSKTNKNKLQTLQHCDCEEYMKNHYKQHEEYIKNHYKHQKPKFNQFEDELKPFKSNINKTPTEMIYLQRFVSTLLKQFPSRGGSEEENYKVKIKLKDEDKLKLVEFINKGNIHLNEIDAILTELFVESQVTNEYGETYFLGNINQDAKDLIKWVLISTGIMLTGYFAIKMPISHIAIILFLFGTFWHWQHMYQQALAQRHSELTKNPDLPKECRPQQLSWLEGLKVWWMEDVWKNEDKCEKYFKNLMVDPIWDVSPTMAFSTMFTQFITYPLGVLGTNLGNFFKSLFRELPPLAIFIVFPFLLFVIIAILLTNAGYSIRGIGFAIGPANQPTVANQPRQMVEDLQRENKSNVETKIEAPKPTYKAINNVNIKKNSGVEELEDSEKVTIEVRVNRKPRKSLDDKKNDEVDEKGDLLR